MSRIDFRQAQQEVVVDAQGRVTQVIHSSESKTEYFYDAIGEIKSEEQIQPARAKKTVYTYDEEGRVISRTVEYTNAEQNIQAPSVMASSQVRMPGLGGSSASSASASASNSADSPSHPKDLPIAFRP